MKYKINIFIAILAAVLLCGACEKEEPNSFTGKENMNKDASYAIGMSIGEDLLNNMSTSGVYPNIEEFLKGLGDVMKSRETRLNLESAYELVEAAFSAISNERNEIAAQAEKSYLAENARRSGINILPSGLQYEVIMEGDGPKPSLTDTVLVHYEGSFTDGRVFDSSLQYGEPAAFALENVIPGWAEGLQLMSVGSQYLFCIPSAIGYGPNGLQSPYTGELIIPPYSALIFNVILLEINPEIGVY